VPQRKAEALAFERKLSLLICALMGLNETQAWLRDPVLNRHVGAALGRGLELLREVRKVTEGA